MTLKIVGAGLGRTGTHSLKLGLERILGGRCYHMVEVLSHPEHVAVWHAALRDEPVDWAALFDGYVAAVDWPVAGVWRAIAESYPDAQVLLSTRPSADDWWTSASQTIFPGMLAHPAEEPWRAMAMTMMERFTPDWLVEDRAKLAYERHNTEVRATVPADRLIDWQPSDGWTPLCDALGVPVPDEPFPLTNTAAEIRARLKLDPL